MPKVDIPSWLSALVAILFLAGGIAASWYDNRTEVEVMQATLATQQAEINRLQVKNEAFDRRFDDLEKILVKVDTTLDFLRGRLGFTNGGTP